MVTPNTNLHERAMAPANQVTDFIAQFYEPQAWREQALCHNYPTTFFFPDPGHADQGTAAKQVCVRCPVQSDCLTWALDNRAATAFGIWGNTTANERDQIRRTRRQQKDNPDEQNKPDTRHHGWQVGFFDCSDDVTPQCQCAGCCA